MTYFLQQTINGISVGAIYAMIAVGYSMVYGLLYLINFAHGDLYVMGTFVVYSCLVTFGASGIISPMLSCLAGAIVAGIIGILTERFAYRPIRSGNRNISMVSALGVSAMLKTTSQVIWGPESKEFPSFGCKCELYNPCGLRVGRLSWNTGRGPLLFLLFVDQH